MKSNLIYIFSVISILLAACSSNKTEEKLSASDMDSIASTPQVVKTADIKFKVKNASKCGKDVSALAHSMRGMVMHHQLQSTLNNSNRLPISQDSVLLVTSYTTQADITVRIPSENMEVFMDKVADMAVFVDNRNMNIEDKRLEYFSNFLKAENREEVTQSQQRAKKLTVKEADQLLIMKDDKVDRIISNYQTKADTEYSLVNLSFYHNNFVGKERVANDDLILYRVPFSTSIQNALLGGWHAFESLIIALAHLWAFVVLGIGIWFGWKFYAKNKTTGFLSKASS